MQGKAMTWDVRRAQRFMNCADQQIGKFENILEEQCRFLADPSQPLWYNAKRHIEETTMEELESRRPSKMTCHNLLRPNPLSRRTNQLL